MRAYLSRTSAPTPVLIRAANGFQIILGKVRPITSPGREPSTSSDHCSHIAHQLASMCRTSGGTGQLSWSLADLAVNVSRTAHWSLGSYWLKGGADAPLPFASSYLPAGGHCPQLPTEAGVWP